MFVPTLEDRDAVILGEGLVFLGQSSYRAFIYFADVTAIRGSYKVKDGKMYISIF